ncbi:MAG: DsbA family protein [Pseudomonadota bacterium]
MHPRESSAPLIVYLDVKSPYALVALRPTLDLEAATSASFDWRPLTLDIPSYLGSAQKRDGRVVTSRGRSERTWKAIRYSYGDARRYAERQGLVLKGTEKIWNSRMANIGILWMMRTARPRLSAYLNAVFLPFWRRELDIESLDTVQQCIEAAGADSRGFATFLEGAGGVLHDRMHAQFHDQGIFGVPSYVLDGEVFHGREHLPYLRWVLTGGHGTPPDIAYEL